jgi:hypothetical protein
MNMSCDLPGPNKHSGLVSSIYNDIHTYLKKKIVLYEKFALYLLSVGVLYIAVISV